MAAPATSMRTANTSDEFDRDGVALGQRPKPRSRQSTLTTGDQVGRICRLGPVAGLVPSLLNRPPGGP